MTSTVTSAAAVKDDTKDSQLLAVPDEFAFPYATPYSIQVDFMKALYRALELKKVGIFESPTGTGKSLSLICGSLKWLKDWKANQKRQLDQLIVEQEQEKKKKAANTAAAFDWLTDYQENFEKNQQNLDLKERLEKQVKQEKTYQDLKAKAKQLAKQRKLNIESSEKRVMQSKLNYANLKTDKSVADDTKSQDSALAKEDLDLILDDYKSDDDEEEDAKLENDELNDNQTTKIFFCSRTHSQLTQFIGELNKTAYAEDARVVTLGSRMNLCINDSVLKLGSLTAVNERCLDLQKSKKSTNKSGSKRTKLEDESSRACSYYKPSAFDEFNMTILEEVCDIEDVAKRGRQVKVCPYYGARHSIASAELVALPYNILFQRETRRSFSIDLRGHVVIIDEAHNLIDTIAQIHSVEIGEAHVRQALAQLNAYVAKYKSRFAARNMLYLRQLLSTLTALGRLFDNKQASADAKLETDAAGKLSLRSTKIWTLNEFLVTTRLLNLNFTKLLRFCDETQLEKKLIGFSERYAPAPSAADEELSASVVDAENKNGAAAGKSKSATATAVRSKQHSSSDSNAQQQQQQPNQRGEIVLKSPLMQIKQLIQVLSSPLYDGRLLLTIDPSTRSTLKYMLLNPSVCFEEIASQAHAVILAGGTMKPIGDFEHLIGNKSHIEYFSCGHVIPRENMMCLAVCTGPSGGKFDFSYNSRDNTQMLDELGKYLLQLSGIVPSGMVVFFVSYDYLEKVVGHFRKSNLLDKLNANKQVFYEPRLSSECDKVFADFTRCIKKPTKSANSDKKATDSVGGGGAMLFAVVGGKMSEGINFSDDLGRCVIVVGLPYANIKSVELQEKMQYLNKHQATTPGAKPAGQQYYESMCWKAINQSIGRAIRHQNDYASVLLCDARYCNQPLASLREKLPQWIGDSLRQESAAFDNKQIAHTLSTVGFRPDFESAVDDATAVSKSAS